MSQTTPPTDDEGDRRARERSWVDMFRDALRGVKIAIRGEVNFFVHLFIAVIAGVGGGILKVSDNRWWCIYILCVTIVLTAELFNTAIEHLARAVTREQHPEVRDALDIASGAVLVAATGAGFVGFLMIAWPLVKVLRH